MAWLGRDLELDLGTATCADRTWYQGVMIGETRDLLPDMQVFRRYRIPGWANLRQRGELTIRLDSRIKDDGLQWAAGGVAVVRLASAADGRDW